MKDNTYVKNARIIHFKLEICLFVINVNQGTVLCGGNWLWAWQITWALQTCIAERSKVPNG